MEVLAALASLDFDLFLLYTLHDDRTKAYTYRGGGLPEA
ncbi:hypothetical protein SAMN05216298_5108 [Glycomyces sambucus]|uniref:Uncharacterized protein n=1 Tax=Glycomyces sambucus TaxID=380244 RepID=A0A1G9MPM8_9ACTN|nr:hypothetical protein SAMN05216298_5108 [Glycomyces sambucus]